MTQAPPKELRARVDRLMSGKFLEIDAHELFIWLRDHCRKNFDLVRDVGDFCAHRHKRNKGSTWERGNDFCEVMLFDSSLFGSQLDVDLGKRGLIAKARLMPQHAIDANFGLTHETFNQLVMKGAAGIVGFSKRTPEFERSVDGDTKDLIRFLSETRTGPTPILENHFLWETYNLMCDTHLIDRNSVYDFENISDFLTVFAMSRMHLVRLEKAPYRATLEMGTSSNMINRLVVHIRVEYDSEDEFLRRFTPSTTMFMSACDVRTWCVESLQSKPIPEYAGMFLRPNWDVALDFSNGLISPFDLENHKNLPGFVMPAYAEPPEPPNGFITKCDLNGSRPH